MASLNISMPDEMCAVMGDYPEIGSERSWLNPRLKGVRMLPLKQPFRSIVIHYRITDEVVHVVHIRHGARSLGDFADEDAL
jgi:plasmid stabilization system protein ParE